MHYTHIKCMQVLFVSIFIFSRTVSSLMEMWLLLLLLAAMLLVLLLQLLNYIYSFYINLSFNDVNDFIFRFFFRRVLCWILIPWYFLHVLTDSFLPLTHTHTHSFAILLAMLSSIFLFFSRIVLHIFSLCFSFVLFSYHHQVYIFFYIIHDFSANILFIEIDLLMNKKNCYPITHIQSFFLLFFSSISNVDYRCMLYDWNMLENVECWERFAGQCCLPVLN